MKCGHGQRERMRVNLIKSDTESCDSRCMTQTINCTDNPPCENNMRMGKMILIFNCYIINKLLFKCLLKNVFTCCVIRGYFIVRKQFYVKEI